MIFDLEWRVMKDSFGVAGRMQVAKNKLRKISCGKYLMGRTEVHGGVLWGTAECAVVDAGRCAVSMCICTV